MTEADTFTYIKHCGTLTVYRNDRTGKYHLVNEIGNQVFSCMPGDHPAGGNGRWVSRATNYGIAYVSNGYSRSYVNRIIHQYGTEGLYS